MINPIWMSRQIDWFFTVSILVTCVFGLVSGAVPNSTVGPSGATFKTSSTWPDYQIAAFADLNADRRMDVILVDLDGTKLYASISPSTKSSFSLGLVGSKFATALPSPSLLLSPALTEPIRSVVPADFNGDSVLDLLLLTSASTTGPFKAFVAYGDKGTNRGSFVFENKTSIATFQSQPLVCDMNADSIADIFGQVDATSRLLILGGANLEPHKMAYSGSQWSKLGYSAFGDIDGNGVPEIVIVVERNSELSFQLIRRDNSKLTDLTDVSHIELPDALRSAPHSYLGLFTLVDLDSDGNIELLLPACTSSDCHRSSLFSYNFQKASWSNIDVNWTPKGVPDGSTWFLSPTPPFNKGLSTSNLVGPAVGDLNLDGYLDVLVGLSYQSSSQTGSLPAVLLNEGPDPNTGLIRFQAYLLPGASLPQSDTLLRQLGLFYDREKGVLDIFVVSWNPSTNRPTVSLLLQQLSNDYYFIKVTILNGLCANSNSCPDNRLPYGLPVPGQRSSYVTESVTGSKISSVGLITTQSCCTALQLPSVVFGLGPFANYVERVTVSIPSTSTVNRTLSIPALVPNAEVFVNPYPLDDPNSWTAKLFLQPLYNMKVLYIAITLIVVCVVLIAIIAILLCLEIREDRVEKLREAQRFHFDAM